MELIKKRIHYVREGKKIFDQFYVDEDYNVPEAKEDVRRIVDTGTELKIEEIRPVENYVRITGKLYFRILYLNVSSDPKPGVLEGKLPFEEMVYAENQEGEEFYVQNVRIEFTPSLIHSRKLSLRAMVELEVGREKLVDEETVTDAPPGLLLWHARSAEHLSSAPAVTVVPSPYILTDSALIILHIPPQSYQKDTVSEVNTDLPAVPRFPPGKNSYGVPAFLQFQESAFPRLHPF